MSRIGKNPIAIPDDVNVIIEGKLIKVSGIKGKLDFYIDENIEVEITYSIRLWFENTIIS